LLVVVAACGGDEPTADAVAGTASAPADAATGTTGTTGAVTATTTSDSGAAGGGAVATTGAPPVVEGQPVEILRFTAPLVGGGTFDANTATERPIAFWFWAPT
jgi:hypothetical protein